MFVEDAAIKWFGAPGWLTAEALHECECECVLAQGSASAHSADVVLLNLSPVLSPIKVLPGQLSMVLNLEAHSLSERALAATDLLVSFHPESDVPVTYAYALLQASPCRHSNRTAACLERHSQHLMERDPMPPREAAMPLNAKLLNMPLAYSRTSSNEAAA